ncbi:hypothetical protein [Synechococcus sp. PCC 7336]|uniref:hypothetical protein n=1 Tax=Synechococcus sp. PCC 7336 TaxID=195250 RepID=UPI000345E909|nr:hypothetical protein [Synechococcus sp. PCC 7336]
MNYLVAVLSDRMQAESAYTALEKAGLPMDKVAILGKGYRSADEFGLINPQEEARKQATLMSYWLVPFGFVAGIAFNLSTGFVIVGNPFGDRLLGGVLGAIAGAMGSFFVGGGAGIAFGSGDALPYRNRLNEGKYLIVVQGSDASIRSATPILRQFDPEALQGYTDYNLQT